MYLTFYNLRVILASGPYWTIRNGNSPLPSRLLVVYEHLQSEVVRTRIEILTPSWYPGQAYVLFEVAQ